MSRSLAALLSLLLIGAADRAPWPHASGQAAGPGPGCGGGFIAARGDTLYSIARRCQSSVAELVQENRLGSPPRLGAGQALAIPGFERAVAARPEDRRPPPRVAPPPPPPRDPAHVYRFRPGDTLFSLARWAQVRLPALRAANPGIDPAKIEIGTPIRLPRGAVRPEPQRLRERGGPVPAAAPAPPPPPPRRPQARPPVPDEADKPRPVGEVEDEPDDDDRETPGGMDDGGPEPEGM